MLAQRLAKAEDTNAQLQGELSVMADKVKLTQGEEYRAKMATKKIKEDDAKELADLQTNVTGQLATKASVDDLNKVGTDVNGVKGDLETTKNSLNLTRGEFGTLIAKNHDEVEELRRLGRTRLLRVHDQQEGRTPEGGQPDGGAPQHEPEEEPVHGLHLR